MPRQPDGPLGGTGTPELRAATAAGSAALAGFAMGIGYLFGTLGPLLGGTLYSATGGWTAALLVFAATGLLMVAGGWMMTPKGRYLEDKFTAGTTDSRVRSAPRNGWPLLLRG